MEHSVNINFYGLNLICQGDYYASMPETFTNPGSPAEFNINKVECEFDKTADPESIILKAKLWEELEMACVEKIERE